MTPPPPPLALPDALRALVDALSAKDRARFTESVAGLHLANHRLWMAEDEVRNAADSGRVADGKRTIDQLNLERTRHAERVDEAMLGNATAPADPAPALHTESLSSAIDRLSVTVLRQEHTRRAAATDPALAERIGPLQQQVADLHTAVDTLAAEVAAGKRRLPHGARFKLYRAVGHAQTPVQPSTNLPLVIALGGLSECGKSSSGIFLRRAEGAARFKIGYLLTQGAARQGLADPYVLSPLRQAELLLGELNRFADAHADVSTITIESVHDAASIAALKSLMGATLRLVYLDVPAETRRARSGMSEAAITAKDRVKTGRGADAIPADVVIDNSGSIIALHNQLRRLAHPPAQPAAPAHCSTLRALPAPLREASGRLLTEARTLADRPALIAVTGSAATGEWAEAWSDVDLLIIADHVDTPGLRRAVENYRRRLDDAHIPLGVTLLSTAEVAARRVPHRILYNLYRIQQGQPVLLADPHLHLAPITRQEVERATPAELAQVIVTTRRLRHSLSEPSLRPLYKHLILACRLILREQGTWIERNNDVLAAARRLPGLEPLDPPPLAQVIAAHRGHTPPGPVRRHIEAAVDQLLAWHTAQARTEPQHSHRALELRP